MGVQASWFGAPFLSNFRNVANRRERAMTRAALLRYFCAHFWLAVLRKDDVYMMKMHFCKPKLNLEEETIEYKRLRQCAELR